MTINFDKVLKKVLKLHPELVEFPDDAEALAHEWCQELAYDASQRQDTDCIQDHMPAEYFTERAA